MKACHPQTFILAIQTTGRKKSRCLCWKFRPPGLQNPRCSLPLAYVGGRALEIICLLWETEAFWSSSAICYAKPWRNWKLAERRWVKCTNVFTAEIVSEILAQILYFTANTIRSSLITSCYFSTDHWGFGSFLKLRNRRQRLQRDPGIQIGQQSRRLLEDHFLSTQLLFPPGTCWYFSFS